MLLILRRETARQRRSIIRPSSSSCSSSSTTTTRIGGQCWRKEGKNPLTVIPRCPAGISRTTSTSSSTLFRVLGFLLLLAAAGGAEGSTNQQCDDAAVESCRRSLEACLLTEPALNPRTHCECTSLYYGYCLWEAGCAASTRMASCEEEMLTMGCEPEERALCGNNCLEPGQALQSDALILSVNNWSQYYLRVLVCQKALLSEHNKAWGMVVAEPCSDAELMVCDYWIAPESSYVPLAIPSNSTAVTLEYCHLDDENEGGEGGCVADPPPITFHGSPPDRWPRCLSTVNAPRSEPPPHLCEPWPTENFA
jgi:hypothetical protein